MLSFDFINQNKLTYMVTGSSIRAEQWDRPLAYKFRERWCQLFPHQSVIVLSDLRFLHELENSQEGLFIAIGGPGENAACEKWFPSLDIVMQQSNRWYIQMHQSIELNPRICIWGMHYLETKRALDTFCDTFLNPSTSNPSFQSQSSHSQNSTDHYKVSERTITSLDPSEKSLKRS